MIGACLADPFANGEERIEFDTFTIPKGAQAAGVSTRIGFYVTAAPCQFKSRPGVAGVLRTCSLDGARGNSVCPFATAVRRETLCLPDEGRIKLKFDNILLAPQLFRNPHFHKIIGEEP
jgi:hypothetical protein